jgi:branched-chain amino acid transport system ATP-binding protein
MALLAPRTGTGAATKLDRAFILTVENLQAGYTSMPIVQGVSIRCQTQKVTTLIGPNGCGKSTLLKSIVGLLRPSAGKVVLDGTEVTGRRPEDLLRMGVSMVPQIRSVFPKMTAEENVLIGGYLIRDRSTLQARVDEVFGLFPVLQKRRSKAAGTLSGGEQRLLELGRALVMKPKVLLLDEPSAMLAPAILEALFDEIRRITSHGTTIVLVEQNIRKAFEITDYVYVLDYGRNRIDGTPEECLHNPELAELFLG